MNLLGGITSVSNIKTGIPPVSGYSHFESSIIADDVSGGMVSNMQIHNGQLRPDFDNDPNCIFLTTYGGHEWLEHRLNPTSPGSPYLPTTSGDHHFRSEISLWVEPDGWEAKFPLGTEIWFSRTYLVPNDVNMWTQGALVIFQAKDSSNASEPAKTTPVLSLEIAYPGQMAHGSDPLRQTPLGGEPVLVALGKDSRWTPIGAPRLYPGGPQFTYTTHIIAQADNTGLWENWFNGTKYVFPGYTSGGVERTPGDYQITAMGDYPGFGIRFPNIKSGLYHLGYKHATEGAAEISNGHTQMRLLTTDYNVVIRTPSDPDYMNFNGYYKVDTSGYNR